MAQASRDYDELFKIRVIGDSGVGKSSLIQQFKDGTFSSNIMATIGVDFAIKTVNMFNKVVKLQIWDTAGQERFRTITNTYYRYASGIYLVYDVSDRESFRNLEHWMQDIQNNCESSVQVCLIGNKNDLQKERKVSYQEGEDFALKTFNGIPFFEASAKTGENVEIAFHKLVENLLINKNNFSYLPKDISQLSTAKDHLKILGVNEDVFSGSSLAQKDEKGIIHYYPAKNQSPNYLKYCDINILPKINPWQYDQTLKKYTSHETLYCTKVNLLLAADSNQISSHDTFINNLQSAIYHFATKGQYQVKKNQLLYRGVDCSKKEIDAYKENEILYFPSFMSTSENKDKFYQGANYNTIFIIRFEKIPNCAFRVSNKQSKYEEAEVLFKCYSKFKVEKKTNNVVVNGKQFENIIELLHLNEPVPEQFQNSVVQFFSQIKKQTHQQKRKDNTEETVDGKPKQAEKGMIVAQQPEETKVCKIVIAGAHQTGKSSVLQRYVDNSFSNEQKSTIGVDFKIKIMDVGKQKLKLQMVFFLLQNNDFKWDTAGQERFRSITASYYTRAQGIIIVYDISNKVKVNIFTIFKNSFEQVGHYLEEAKNGTKFQADVRYLLLGNKVDNSENRQVSIGEGQVILLQMPNYFQELCSLKQNVFQRSFSQNRGRLSRNFCQIYQELNFVEFLFYFQQNKTSFDENEFTADLDSLQGKASMEEMKINIDSLKNKNFAEIDKFGIVHFYPQEQLGKNYQQFCTGWQPSLANNEIISIVNQYTNKDTMLCTKLNLLLASDSEQLKENAKEIKQLRYAIYKLAGFYPVKVKQVYRGMDSSEKEFNKFELGKTIYLPSFTSTSKNSQKLYKDQKQNTIFVINLVKIPQQAFVVTKKYSKNAENDEEVLFACYSKFKVVKKELNSIFNGKKFHYYIELEVVDQNLAQQSQNDSNQILSAMMFNQFLAIR